MKFVAHSIDIAWKVIKPSLEFEPSIKLNLYSSETHRTKGTFLHQGGSILTLRAESQVSSAAISTICSRHLDRGYH